MASQSRADFVLYGDQQLIVSSSHNQGILYDRSRVFIITGGSVSTLYTYDSSDVNISAGSVTNLRAYGASTVNNTSSEYMESLYARDRSVVNMSAGRVNHLYTYNYGVVNISGESVISNDLGAYNSSTVNISKGNVFICALDSSVVNITGGSVSLWALDSSDVGISGGSVTNLRTYDSSDVGISGGSVTNFDAFDSSEVGFYGQDFRVAGGLTFEGERVLGTGVLSGKWMDGTQWVVNILDNPSTVTILAIPESEHRPFCVKYPAMDFNGDCKVDFKDFAIMATHWLECNLVPESACWE